MENYEQKYKDALSWMKDLYPTFEGATKEDAEHYFPELKDSEDEKVRKWLIDWANTVHWSEQFSVTKEQVLAWLEKQGEQKLPSLSEKEIVCLKRILDFLRKEHNSYTGEDFTNEIAVLEWLITHPVLIQSSELQQNQGEQKPADKCAGCNNVKGCITCTDGDQYAYIKEYNSAWSKDDEKMWITISDLLWEGFKLSDKKVSWNKIRCWLLPKITYFKDRVQSQSKQEWSEEDEMMLHEINQRIYDNVVNYRYGK